MNKGIVKQWLLLLFVCFTIGPRQIQAQGKPGVFYSITGNGLKDTSWLFGTYHLIKDSYLNEIPHVQAAFRRASGVVVEVVIDSSAMPGANAKAMLATGQLTDFFDKSFADSLDLSLKASIGQGIDVFRPMKPMVVMLTMSVVQLMKDNPALLSKYTGQPLDVYFAAENKAKHKQVTALESVDQQMDLLFNTLSPEQQAVLLKEYIRNKDAGARLGNELMRTYFSNDLEKIAALYQASVQVSGELDFLVKKRNIAWIKQLPSILHSGSTFVAVGALHLAGEGGLVKQLRQMGYTVTAQNLQ
jgi:uncharacterized protein YbaP (TraB family)